MSIRFENGQYILNIGLYPPTEAAFQTLGEAQMAEQQIRFAQKLQEITTQLAQIADDLPDLFKLYWDRGYNAGGANPITDDDVSLAGLTATDVTSMITLVEQLDNFFNARAAAVTDYKSVTNKMRTDI